MRKLRSLVFIGSFGICKSHLLIAILCMHWSQRPLLSWKKIKVSWVWLN